MLSRNIHVSLGAPFSAHVCTDFASKKGSLHAQPPSWPLSACQHMHGGQCMEQAAQNCRRWLSECCHRFVTSKCQGVAYLMT